MTPYRKTLKFLKYIKAIPKVRLTQNGFQDMEKAFENFAQNETVDTLKNLLNIPIECHLWAGECLL